MTSTPGARRAANMEQQADGRGNEFLARTVQDVANEYMEHNLQHTRARKTERDWEMAVRYIVSLGGKERIGDIMEGDVDRFREKLLNAPQSSGRAFTLISARSRQLKGATNRAGR